MGEEKRLRLWSLAWPIFVETTLFMLLGFVDVFILSKYDDLAPHVSRRCQLRCI